MLFRFVPLFSDVVGWCGIGWREVGWCEVGCRDLSWCDLGPRGRIFAEIAASCLRLLLVDDATSCTQPSMPVVRAGSSGDGNARSWLLVIGISGGGKGSPAISYRGVVRGGRKGVKLITGWNTWSTIVTLGMTCDIRGPEMKSDKVRTARQWIRWAVLIIYANMIRHWMSMSSSRRCLLYVTASYSEKRRSVLFTLLLHPLYARATS